MAEALLPIFGPSIERKRDEHLAKLKFLYQSQKTDACLYIAEVAAISVLDEILSDLRTKITQARKKEALNVRL